MYVCMLLSSHNVGKAAYYTDGPYKKNDFFFECIWYTADCVTRIIGTNAFFFFSLSHFKFVFFVLFFKQTCIFYCLTCNNKKESKHFNDSKS